MLHLISNPRKVVAEIYRVLKKGGFFLYRDDQPGVIRSEPFDNTQYNQYVNTLYSEYWTRLGLHHIFPAKYSWKFKREEVCDGFFAQRRGEEYTFGDGSATGQDWFDAFRSGAEALGAEYGESMAADHPGPGCACRCLELSKRLLSQ